MANMYRSVLAGGGGVQPTGDAVAADVLTGKTFSNADGIGKTGTMPNNGAVSGQATPSQPYTIPAGYHNGSGIVTAANSGINIPQGKGFKLPQASAPSLVDVTTSTVALAAGDCFIVNVSNYTGIKFNLDAVTGAAGWTDDLTNITNLGSLAATTLHDISAYDFIAFNANGNNSFTLS